MKKNREERHRTAVLVLDLEDRFARDRRLHGPHPRPFGPLWFYLLGRPAANGGDKQYFEEPWEMEIQRSPSGYHLFLDRIRLPDGRQSLARLSEGQYLVGVKSRLYRPAEAQVGLSDPGRDLMKELEDTGKITVPYEKIDLLPGYAYPFPQLNGVPGPQAATLLRGAIPQTDGLDLSRITVSTETNAKADAGDDYLRYTTDKAGQWQWVLIFPPAETEKKVSLRFFLPNDEEPIELEDVSIKPGSQNTLSVDDRKKLKKDLEDRLGSTG